MHNGQDVSRNGAFMVIALVIADVGGRLMIWRHVPELKGTLGKLVTDFGNNGEIWGKGNIQWVLNCD